jgi:outer membrane protein, heavy metal efflux system
MRYLLYGVLLLALFSTVSSIQAMTLEDAEKIFIENNLELRAKEAELGRYDAAVVGAGLMPNPSFKYNIESVENGKRETEEIYSISQPVDIVGKRGLRKNVASKIRDAERFSYEQEKLNGLAELRKTYYRILYLTEDEKSVKRILDTFMDVRQKTEERLRAGDIAEVELLKISNESKRLIRLLDSLRAEIAAVKRKLATMLNMEMGDIEVTGDFTPSIYGYSQHELVAKALDNSNDIKAAGAELDAAADSVTLSKREVVSPIEIEAGYKRLTGGFNGFALGISIPLPLFNKNQGGIASAKAELEADRLKLEQLKRRTANEISEQTDRAAFLDNRLAHLSEQLETADEITRSVRTAYDEGELSLIELFDAVRSERELLMEYNETVYDYWATLFELEKITGIKLRGSGGLE